MRDFDDAVVVVTGASSGLGRAIAQEVARRGAKAVAINFLGPLEEGEQTATVVRDSGAEPILVPGDVANDADCRRVAASVSRFGRIDALFNNAGTTKFAVDHSQLDAVSGEDFARIYAVNVIGPYQMIRAARSLLEAGSHAGAVVNTASLAGIIGVGSSVPYAASKGALITMTLSLARALAPKIRVNAICPGFIDTPWFKMPAGDVEKLRQSVIATVPLHLASKPEDIALPAVFLA
ncbi:MAG: SDR family oxidoreductase, partial [Sinobacteraceae bacterium]|nr:SDR family oxidoreductase [Nevskiaceae bacterium]